MGYKGGCSDDHLDDRGIKAGQKWTSSTSRGRLCLVTKVVAVLTLSDGRGILRCTNYEDSGTSNYMYHIYMGGGDGCCVRSSFQHRLCEPQQTHVRNPNYDYSTVNGWW